MIKNVEHDELTLKQLRYFDNEIGGNRRFLTFMKKYNLENETIKNKYEAYPTIFWSKRLRAFAKKQEFLEEEPATNWKDNLNYYLDEMKNYFANLKISGQKKLQKN